MQKKRERIAQYGHVKESKKEDTDLSSEERSSWSARHSANSRSLSQIPLLSSYRSQGGKIST